MSPSSISWLGSEQVKRAWLGCTAESRQTVFETLLQMYNYRGIWEAHVCVHAISSVVWVRYDSAVCFCREVYKHYPFSVVKYDIVRKNVWSNTSGRLESFLYMYQGS